MGNFGGGSESWLASRVLLAEIRHAAWPSLPPIYTQIARPGCDERLWTKRFLDFLFRTVGKSELWF
jgi:hypothetical protein